MKKGEKKVKKKTFEIKKNRSGSARGIEPATFSFRTNFTATGTVREILITHLLTNLYWLNANSSLKPYMRMHSFSATHKRVIFSCTVWTELLWTTKVIEWGRKMLFAGCHDRGTKKIPKSLRRKGNSNLWDIVILRMRKLRVSCPRIKKQTTFQWLEKADPGTPRKWKKA